ncbi:unnamed protein product [[Candida] boidinii]|uniref:Unnamed protein product n=1 Tax=Candida boidinii TaxID=5477 RepID=A0ACB5TJI2_CANBO|nr:unnamed protein product [[Candida] boidinii]
MAPLQQVSRHGGPNKCFGEFQKVVECMTSSKNPSNEPCQHLKNDYIECRRHKVESYKMFIMEKHLEERGLDKEELGAPFVKKRDYLTPKTLGLVNGDDHAINTNKF